MSHYINKRKQAGKYRNKSTKKKGIKPKNIFPCNTFPKYSTMMIYSNLTYTTSKAMLYALIVRIRKLTFSTKYFLSFLN